MKTRRRYAPNILRITVIVSVVLACIVVVLLVVAFARSHINEVPAKVTSDASYVPIANVLQQRLGSDVDLTSYVQSRREQLASLRVADLPTHTDWTTHDVIVLEYSVYTARSIQAVTLEALEGAPTIVIQVKEAMQGCMYAQVNETHLLFVEVPKGDTRYPVALQLVANHDSCRLR